MKTIFLCGGIGERMFPLTRDKFLYPFLGESLLQRHLRFARKAGLKDFVIVANPSNKSLIAEAVGEEHVDIVVQPEPLGMGDALLQTKDLVGDEPVLIVGAGEIFEFQAYKKILRTREKEDADSLLLAEEVEQYFPGGYLRFNEQHEITGIIEKPGEGNEPSNLVNLIMHYHSDPRNLFELIETVETDRDDEYELAMDRMIDETTFKAVPYSGWEAIKYPWHILEAMDHYLGKVEERKIAEGVKIAERAKIDGPVWIGEGTKVLEGAVIRGPSYIGKNVMIGNNALVRRAHICEGAVIGFSSEVKHSYISEKTLVHDAYVGDSVIGKECNLGAGTVLANWRFDEKEVRVRVKGAEINTHYEKLGAFLGPNCKTGVNSSVMPGVKMAPGSRLGPNIALKRDLMDQEVRLTQEE